MKTTLRVIGISIGIVMFSWLCVNIYITLAESPEASAFSISEAYEQKAMLDSQIFENKRREEILTAELNAVVAELVQWSKERSELQKKIDDYVKINGSDFKKDRESLKTIITPGIPAKPQRNALCFKHTAGEDQNQYVRYAAEISDNDLEFLCTLDGENGEWTPDRQSEVYSKGVREQSFGFCQVNKIIHPEIVNDPRFFADPKWQLDKCWEMYQAGVSFFGKKHCWKTKKNFSCPE